MSDEQEKQATEPGTEVKVKVKTGERDRPEDEKPRDEVSVTRHRVTVGGRELAYTVTAGTMVLAEEKHAKDGESEGVKPRARVFFVAYALDAEQDPRTRPVTFSFNGGPGSSSVWLHLGLLGPRRVVMGDAGELTGPPYDLTDNEFTLLTHSDLVFIDPVSTGYSRVTEGEKPGDFHGFQKDIESVGDFIRLWTSRAGRWLSPKFLIGESYGTTRAAGLSGYLQERHGLFLNGIMLISSILDFSTVDFTPGHDLPYIVHLPTAAATAWYHGKLGGERSLNDVLREAEAFADGDYARALHLGPRLSEEEQRVVAERYAALTGLDVGFVRRNNLRVTLARFCKELLRDEGRTVGRLDSRFTGLDRDSGGEANEYDPSLSAILGPYTAAMNHYVRAELGFESDLPYEILTMRVRPWSYKEFENKHVRVSDTLRKAMHQNEHLKVLVASGYFDFATPYHATRHTLDHLGLDPSLRGNVREVFYEAGHMMYVHRPSLERQYADLVEFVEWGAGRG
ncbi:carboxypeptidase C (cathepsin A) [Deinococcus sp. HSC-46F16]|uniref:S10 family peptidase n=1 Tax=Deinococcus sp. HSC-46F16 TaxID=2910968 RepID=UPI0020A1BBC2|nr:peptidase S10 [Deinococcus sp. HSC-46F16]MCP2013187.1 carboxypeptidase C (cathepsin A) [Deinococcus sp. HSC-46F16]